MDVGSEFLSLSSITWVLPEADTLYHRSNGGVSQFGLPNTFSHQDVKANLAAGMRRPHEGVYQGLLWVQKT